MAIVGIDVGGTHTDGVLLVGRTLKAWTKLPTREDLGAVLTEVWHRLLEEGRVKPEEVSRITFSTTLITNLVAKKELPPVGLVLIPGGGVDPSLFYYGAASTLEIRGMVDFRGRELVPIDEKEVEEAACLLRQQGLRRVAVVGKFSHRYPAQEERVAEWLHRIAPELEITLGSKVAGGLGFPRRAATAVLTAAIKEHFDAFYRGLQEGISRASCPASLFLLRADGGTMPLAYALQRPVETAFSGPAASAMGALALSQPDLSAVVLDVGGTTTDIALLLEGHPLTYSRGAVLEGRLLQLSSLAVHSVPLGGDSWVRVERGELRVGPERKGGPYACGGPVPTLTDALRVLNLSSFGDEKRAWEAMRQVGEELGGKDPQATARVVLDQAVRELAEAVRVTLERWAQEPAYRLWQVKHQLPRPQKLIGVGAAASGLVPEVARWLGLEPFVPPLAPVANALGAALARVTLSRTYVLDTQQGRISVLETGKQERLNRRGDLLPPEAEELALELFRREALSLGIDPEGARVTSSEVFNVVRHWRRVGRIYEIEVRLPPGVLFFMMEEGTVVL
ncbi:Hydantoinase/oxoprolinase [Ammonifex degensii KC4]|uniref:Hydantoinase/oxoprolinase n=1 Tax=Ammonifex degensii (strain DSM 10501 / KC4) TaxID=429009 RepID=C9RD06_AMMDK|nr:hydantoinase/oxoprolinase family protein [Ammonifex degensii]ACX52133.1 Hydantoinase/oxoprolinase [Ammonifex degensii KC4]